RPRLPGRRHLLRLQAAELAADQLPDPLCPSRLPYRTGPARRGRGGQGRARRPLRCGLAVPGRRPRRRAGREGPRRALPRSAGSGPPAGAVARGRLMGLLRILDKLLGDERGGTATLFALSLPVLAVLGCGAIDLTAVNSDRSRA